MRDAGLTPLAFSHCGFREDQRRTYGGFLLVQLCLQSDSYGDIISKFYSSHAQGFASFQRRCTCGMFIGHILPGLAPRLSYHGRLGRLSKHVGRPATPCDGLKPHEGAHQITAHDAYAQIRKFVIRTCSYASRANWSQISRYLRFVFFTCTTSVDKKETWKKPRRKV